MRKYIDRYNSSWKRPDPGTTTNKVALGIRLLFAVCCFVLGTLIAIRVLPPPTHATIGLAYDLMSILIRVLFFLAYLVIDWIIFVKMRGY